MLIGVLESVLAAIAYGAATVLQAFGIKKLRSERPTTTRHRLRAGFPYGVGLALDGVGFVAAAAALQTLPLFFVQAVSASAVAITAVLAVLFLGTRLSRTEIVALAAVGLGLVALAAAAGDGPPAHVSTLFEALTFAAAIAIAALVAIAYRLRNDVVMAFAAGLGFSGVGIAARIMTWGAVPDLLSSFAFWALLAHGVLAMVAYTLALDLGEATKVSAINFSTETIVPSAIGLVFLHDSIRHGFVSAAAIGFVLTLAGCIALARQGEVTA